jgi:hypothetical protein
VRVWWRRDGNGVQVTDQNNFQATGMPEEFKIEGAGIGSGEIAITYTRTNRPAETQRIPYEVYTGWRARLPMSKRLAGASYAPWAFRTARKYASVTSSRTLC